MVSLDAVTPSTNDRLRGKCDTVLKSIDELICSGYAPAIGIVLSKNNLQELPYTLQYCVDHKLSPFISVLDNCGRGCTCSEFTLSEVEIIEACNHLIKHGMH